MRIFVLLYFCSKVSLTSWDYNSVIVFFKNLFHRFRTAWTLDLKKNTFFQYFLLILKKESREEGGGKKKMKRKCRWMLWDLLCSIPPFQGQDCNSLLQGRSWQAESRTICSTSLVLFQSEANENNSPWKQLSSVQY